MLTPKELADLFTDYISNGVPSRYTYNNGRHYPTDWEISHSSMDDRMVEVLRALGYGEAMDLYESITRWYA